MTLELEKLARENVYLKGRCAQLQSDIDELGAALQRAREQLERLHDRRGASVPNPLSGGQ